MISGIAKLIVDLGNSSTKCRVKFGKDPKTGLMKERTFELSNEFALIADDYVVSRDYNEKTSFILHVDSSIGGRAVVGNFCNGDLQKKEKSLSVIKPSATSRKWQLPSSLLSCHFVFYHAMRMLCSMTGVSDFSEIDVSWDVTVLLPPGDVSTGTPFMEAIFKGITKTEMVFPKVTVPVKVNKVFVLPEGFCAYVALVYDKGCKIRPENKFLLDEVILVIDIGAGTSDFLIIRKNTLVQNSMFTTEQGGNNVFQSVRRRLRLDGLDLMEEEIKDGIIVGYVKDGSKQVNIVETINVAKEDVAQKLLSAFQDFIEATDTKVRSIGFILVSGGGAMSDSSDKGIKTLADSVVENFKILAPNCSPVTIPITEFKIMGEDGSVITKTEPISPRWLNLEGASILAEMLK